MSAIASWEGFSTTDLTRSRARRHLQVVPEVQPRPVTRSDRLRLTRAGRLALTVLIALLLSGVALAVMTPRAVSSPQRVVTVQAGQTLSELAATLMPEVRDHDPHLALDGGRDGLDAYRAILAEARKRLKRDGALVLEIGSDQLPHVKQLMVQARLADITFEKDLAGLDRMLVGHHS